MNYAWQQDKPFRMMVAFVAAMVVLALAGTSIPAQAQTYKVLYEFPINGPEPTVARRSPRAGTEWRPLRLFIPRRREQ